ncbi:hypothetical protein C0989_006734, partial [Termitomyces sp. Mn162]
VVGVVEVNERQSRARVVQMYLRFWLLNIHHYAKTIIFIFLYMYARKRTELSHPRSAQIPPTNNLIDDTHAPGQARPRGAPLVASALDAAYDVHILRRSAAVPVVGGAGRAGGLGLAKCRRGQDRRQSRYGEMDVVMGKVEGRRRVC